jgi:hypothetical protein
MIAQSLSELLSAQSFSNLTTFSNLSAGVVPIAHNSGGPREDIVTSAAEGKQPNGFLCESREQYAEAIATLLCMTSAERHTYAAAARRWVNKPQDLISCDDAGW